MVTDQLMQLGVGEDAIHVDKVAERAERAARVWAEWSPASRAQALLAIAEGLEENESELIALAAEETGLSMGRLTGELRRTRVQIRLFAMTITDGDYLDARLDEADPDFVLGARPDLRRVREPLGPVVNFSASNFPFAFSVMGGDTVSALAAGCPVIVKAHSGHPRLSARTAEIATARLHAAGAPTGTLGLVFSQAAGLALLQDERIRAGSFTGSLAIGTMLAGIAAARPTPIPFFGELGSVNPVYVAPGAASTRAEAIAAGYLASVSGSAGQLCTKPGFLFVPAGSGIADALQRDHSHPAEHRLLTESISRGFAERRTTVMESAGVEVLIAGSLRLDGDLAWTTPTIVTVTVDDLVSTGAALTEEAFGPLSVLVEYSDATKLDALHEQLFPGNLTSTLFVDEDELDHVRNLVRSLSATSGRVIFNGWPTGVAVTPAMEHGGPWPATTSGGTSVGTAAIERFLRGVTYQDAPQDLLPPSLQDANPWRLRRAHSAAGESRHW